MRGAPAGALDELDRRARDAGALCRLLVAVVHERCPACGHRLLGTAPVLQALDELPELLAVLDQDEPG